MLAQAGLCSHGGHGWDGETCSDIPVPECPCCRRIDECWATRSGQREVHDLRQCGHYAPGGLCGECIEAGDADQEFATPDQRYPYCAATDSSPLA